MEIKRNGSQPASKGPAEWLTGDVRIEPLHQADAPSRVSVASVTFEASARTAWHSHPHGQTLVVTAGSGRVQSWGKQMEEIHPGDVVWTAPGEKHSHGAAPTTAMTHISRIHLISFSPLFSITLVKYHETMSIIESLKTTNKAGK